MRVNKIISIIHRKTQDLIYADLLAITRCAFAIPEDSNYFDAYLDHLVHQMIDIIIHAKINMVLGRAVEVVPSNESP